MTEHLQGVVTRIARESLNTKFYRVWCGLHQLDLVLKYAYTELYDNEVVEIIKSFIQHLRQQSELITQIKATYSQLTTRWFVMEIVCNWFLAKRINLFEYIQATDKAIPSVSPQ